MNEDTRTVLLDLCNDYYEKNPDSKEFKLPKVILASKLGLNVNKQGVLCKELAFEYPFIQDTKGYLVINKDGFNEWLATSQELQETYTEEQQQRSRVAELQAILESRKKMITEEIKIIELSEAEIKELDKELVVLTDKKTKQEELKTSLEGQVSHLKAELDKKEAELKPLIEERNSLAENLLKTQEGLEERKAKMNWFIRQANKNRFKQIEKLIREMWHDFDYNKYEAIDKVLGR